jgi:hypothetical protein
MSNPKDRVKDALDRAKQSVGAQTAAPPAAAPPPTQRQSSLSQEDIAKLEELAKLNVSSAEQAAAPAGDISISVAIRKTLELVVGVEDEQQLASMTHQVLEQLRIKPEPTSDELLRRKIEQAAGPIDIGEYLMAGQLSRTVYIGTKRVVLRTVSDGESLWEDQQTRGLGPATSNREVLRIMSQAALATSIVSIDNEPWPVTTQPDHTLHEANLAARLRLVRTLPTPLLVLLSKALAWFSEDVERALTVEALGNG